MNKKIIIGSIFAVLLMLSMPMISNIQAEKLSNTFKEENIQNAEIIETKGTKKVTVLCFGVSEFSVIDNQKAYFYFKFCNRKVYYDGKLADSVFYNDGWYGGLTIYDIKMPPLVLLTTLGKFPILYGSYEE